MTEIGSEIIHLAYSEITQSAIYVPPVAIEELLVEDGAIRTQEGDGVQVLGIHRILNKKIRC